MAGFDKIDNYKSKKSSKNITSEDGMWTPQINGTTKGITMKVLLDVDSYKEPWNQKQIDIKCLV